MKRPSSGATPFDAAGALGPNQSRKRHAHGRGNGMMVLPVDTYTLTIRKKTTPGWDSRISPLIGDLLGRLDFGNCRRDSHIASVVHAYGAVFSWQHSTRGCCRGVCYPKHGKIFFYYYSAAVTHFRRRSSVATRVDARCALARDSS